MPISFQHPDYMAEIERDPSFFVFLRPRLQGFRKPFEALRANQGEGDLRHDMANIFDPFRYCRHKIDIVRDISQIVHETFRRHNALTETGFHEVLA